MSAVDVLSAEMVSQLAFSDTTRNGERLKIRAIAPDDKYEMQRLYPTLSERTLYLRFFRVFPMPSIDEIARYTEVNFNTHLALVVEDEKGNMIAAGRLIRTELGSEIAEFSCLVVDAMQHKGIGRVLVRQLLKLGRQWGIKTVLALVHSENHPMLRLLRTQGYPCDLHFEEGEVLITLEISAPPCEQQEQTQARQGPMHQGAEHQLLELVS